MDAGSCGVGFVFLLFLLVVVWRIFRKLVISQNLHEWWVPFWKIDR